VSRVPRVLGVGRRSLCTGCVLVGAFASSVASAQDLTHWSRVERDQSVEVLPIAPGLELVVARNILKSGERFRFQTRWSIARTQLNDLPLTPKSGFIAAEVAKAEGLRTGSVADGHVIVSVSRVGGNDGEVLEQDADSEWLLRQPGVYQAVARHSRSRAHSNTVLLEVVELRLVEPKRASDGSFELLAVRLGGRGARNEPALLEITSGTMKETVSAVLGQPLRRSFGPGKYGLRASSQYQGVSLTSELEFEVTRADGAAGRGSDARNPVVVPSDGRLDLRSDSRFTVPPPIVVGPVGVTLDLAQPEHVAARRFRFLANLRGGKPGPYDREVTFNVECKSKHERFSGFANEAIVHEMSAPGTCVATATMEYDGALVVSERRQFEVPSTIPSASWLQWLLLLPVLGGLTGASYALKRRHAEGDTRESAHNEAYVPHVAHRVLPSRATVDLTSDSEPRLVLRVTKGSAPPCVEYGNS
jgi:hypothetical protein